MAKQQKTDGLAVELTFGERVSLLELLPEQGTIATIRIVHELRQKLAPSEAELKKFDVQVDHQVGRMTWNAEANKPRKFVIGGFGLKLIVERLEKLSKDEKLAQRHMTLWTKFIEPDAPASEAAEAAA